MGTKLGTWKLLVRTKSVSYPKKWRAEIGHTWVLLQIFCYTHCFTYALPFFAISPLLVKAFSFHFLKESFLFGRRTLTQCPHPPIAPLRCYWFPISDAKFLLPQLFKTQSTFGLLSKKIVCCFESSWNVYNKQQAYLDRKIKSYNHFLTRQMFPISRHCIFLIFLFIYIIVDSLSL